MDEAQEDVLGADVVVIEHLGLFLGQYNDSACSVGKPLKHVCHSLDRGISETLTTTRDYENMRESVPVGRCSPPA